MIGYYKHAPFSLFLRILVSLAIAITVCTLGFLILYILVKGIPFLKPSLFSLTYTSENVSFLPSILTKPFPEFPPLSTVFSECCSS